MRRPPSDGSPLCPNDDIDDLECHYFDQHRGEDSLRIAGTYQLKVTLSEADRVSQVTFEEAVPAVAANGVCVQ